MKIIESISNDADIPEAWLGAYAELYQRAKELMQ